MRSLFLLYLARDEFNNVINSTSCDLAFGENITSFDEFISLSQNNKSKYIQPDLTKYGGISLINNLSKKIQTNKIWLHFLGGGVGSVNICPHYVCH